MVPTVRESRGKIRRSEKVRKKSQGQGKSEIIKYQGTEVNKNAEKMNCCT